MELPATAVYSPGTLGKGFDEVMHTTTTNFCIFSAFFVKIEFFPKFDDTEWFVENLWTQLR
jgi:hypothetical protein